MSTGRKILLAITGIALIALGIICISSPITTVLSLAWLIGVLVLVSGISTFLNWISLRRFFPQSGSIFLSALMQIILGSMFLRNDLALATLLPLMFSFFLMFEGINLSVRSFDYKKAGFSAWWVNLVLGICSAILGFLSLSTPGMGGVTLSAFVGAGCITAGVFYFVAIFAVNRFEKKLRINPWIDEQ
ncbi:MAG: DUF308 domain-containing protein [Bacteroidales bacterium]|nr:DUF308 domain-containing protein [Bacteroidales bacterium]